MNRPRTAASRFGRTRPGRLRLLLLIAALAGAAVVLRPGEGEVRTGRAVVVDGDSLRLEGVAIRLEGLDAPELRQTCTVAGALLPCGEAAKAELARLVAQAPVTCRIVGRDRYRRDLGRCAVDGTDIGAALVAGGHAVAYGRRTPYLREEEDARRRRRGLWAGSFQRPADWRKEHAPERDRVDPSAKP
jgi:endonuclease YncB( thermonuclease family)